MNGRAEMAETEVNLARMGRCLSFWRLAGALLSGLMLAAAFPPLQWDGLAWLAFLPLLLVPQPRGWLERLLIGYVWGYVQFAGSLQWLNEVGFGAGWLLALYCGLYPMLWYALFSQAVCVAKLRPGAGFPGGALLLVGRVWQGLLLLFYGAALWTALEWVRSWMLSGFPWNQLGVALYERLSLLPLAAWTGVYGLTFLLVLANLAVAAEISHQASRLIGGRRPGCPWYVLTAAVPLLPLYWLAAQPEIAAPAGVPELQVVAVQGNIPQCRFWSEIEYEQAVRVYSRLTRAACAEEPRPDLVVWPESAVPASLDYLPYRLQLQPLLRDIRTPLLAGAINYRQNPDNPDEPLLFNSVFLFEETLQIRDYYDKVHRVPFGEYVPGGRYFPWLAEWIGMGRDLTPGTAFSLIRLPKGGKAGVNICFEDVFPEISRAFVRNGANLLMTVTNDSWYNESAGSRQHLANMVFRAVECRRPFLRSGNNSDTCLVTPRGRILDLLADPADGNPFYAGSRLYTLPVYDGWGDTFYTRYGNLFAWLCALASAAGLGGLLIRQFGRQLQAHQAITDKGGKHV